MRKPPAIDETERARVGAALERYKSEHGGIGNPELQARMVTFLECEDGDVPLSTLQRFLRGTHRTSDVMIQRYQKFLSEAATAPPYETMGEAIVAFYSDALKANEYVHYKELMPGRFARRYRIYSQGTREYVDPEKKGTYRNFPVIDRPFSPAFHIPYSWLEITPLAGTPFLRLIERVVNPLRSPVISPHGERGDVQATYEGVLGFAKETQITVATLRSTYPPFFPRFYLFYNFDTVNADKALIDGACNTFGEDMFKRNPLEAFEVMLSPVPDTDKFEGRLWRHQMPDPPYEDAE